MSKLFLKLIALFSLLHLSAATEHKTISRLEWNARPPTESYEHLPVPIKKVVIAHTQTKECNRLAACAAAVRYIQNYHINHGFIDIGYNFLIGGDGLVYEGRGWDWNGQHTPSHNDDTLAIAFIGNFDKKLPQSLALLSALSLLELGEQENKLSPDYKLYGQRQLTPVTSPGDMLYKHIMGWTHWASKKRNEKRLKM